MQATEIERYLRRVGEHLAGRNLVGEIVLVGGAYMSLVLRAREATKDVDAYLALEADAIREAAAGVAGEHGLPEDWLNDAVKGFLFTQPPARLWLEVPGLRIYAPDPAYVFALKAYAGRPEDVRDLSVLRDRIEIRSSEEALHIVKTYIPLRLLTARVQYLMESLFDETPE